MKKRLFNILFIVLKKIKLSQIIFLTFLLIFNAFAWFVYSTEVSNTLNARVKAWKVLFESDTNPIVEYMVIDIDDMRPGMDNFIRELQAHNRSEVTASLNYEILEINILGDILKTKEGKIDAGEVLNGNEITSINLAKKLREDYPFKINFSVSSASIEPGIGMATYKIDVNWPFESGNDNLDTLWGQKSYEYKVLNPSKSSIQMKIKITVTQKM